MIFSFDFWINWFLYQILPPHSLLNSQSNLSLFLTFLSLSNSQCHLTLFLKLFALSSSQFHLSLYLWSSSLFQILNLVPLSLNFISPFLPIILLLHSHKVFNLISLYLWYSLHFKILNLINYSICHKLFSLWNFQFSFAILIMFFPFNSEFLIYLFNLCYSLFCPL